MRVACNRLFAQFIIVGWPRVMPLLLLFLLQQHTDVNTRGGREGGWSLGTTQLILVCENCVYRKHHLWHILNFSPLNFIFAMHPDHYSDCDFRQIILAITIITVLVEEISHLPPISSDRKRMLAN